MDKRQRVVDGFESAGPSRRGKGLLRFASQGRVISVPHLFFLFYVGRYSVRSGPARSRKSFAGGRFVRHASDILPE